MLFERYLQIARMTVETLTPLSIGTGTSVGLFDTALLRDANGLPAVPGSSLAGVLRHLYRRHAACASCTSRVFGSQNRVSPLSVSWGWIHDSRDRPVRGLLLEKERERLTSDALLRRALEESPLARDHVRLDARGVADGRGKFDRTSLPAGYRFTFELRWPTNDEQDTTLAELASLICLPDFRLGGATRRGLGKIRPVKVEICTLDLGEKKDRDVLADLDGKAQWQELEPKWSSRDTVTATLELEPADGGWRFGQGTTWFGKRTVEGKPADLLPLTEEIVVWNARGASLSRRLVLPGSGIKGALRHRTRFHALRLAGWFVDRNESDAPAWFRGEREAEEVEELFGAAKDTEEEGGRRRETGHAGRLLVDDVYLETQELKSAVVPHNSIDRFTGGVRRGFLFAEEVVTGKKKLRLGVTVLEASRVRPHVRRALVLALCDLANGRLPLGASAGRGHGFFEGEITWSDGGIWAEEAG